MDSRTMAVTLCAVVAGAATPGPGASGPEQETALFPRPKPPYSELFKTPEPKVVTIPQQKTPPDMQGSIRVETRALTSRTVCGMKMIEADPSVDPRIVIPIPEGNTAKIRVLGPPPCDEAAEWRQLIRGTSGPITLSAPAKR